MIPLRSLRSASVVSITVGTALAGLPLLRLYAATPAPPANAHVRVWKTELRDFPILRVAMNPVGTNPKQHLAMHDLGNIGPGFMFDGYVEVPAGRGTLDAYDAPVPSKGPAPRALVSVPVDLAPGGFFTVLVDEPREPKGSPGMEIITDSIDSFAAAQFSVRGLGPGIKDVRVTLGDSLNAQFTGVGGYLLMRGLRSVPYTVRATGTHLDGKPFDWNTTVDFKQHPHQTLLIYPDPYGHIRPRLSVDGEAPPVQPADAPHNR